MPVSLRAGRKTFWQRFGQGGRAGLAIHCALAHSGAWAGVAAALGDRLALTAFDMPGHGRSADWDGAGDYIGETVAVAASFRDAPVDLIGHSGGAVVALGLALQAPGLVRSLTLIEPVLFAAAQGTPGWDDHLARMVPFAAAIRAGDPVAAARAFSAEWGAGESWADLPDRQRAYVAERIALIEACEPALSRDSHGLLGEGVLERLDMPVMLIAGAKSPPVIHAIHEALAARLADVGVATVDGAGHMAPITHPRQVAGLIAVNLDR